MAKGFNVQGLMKQAKEMQKQMLKTQDELKNKTVEVSVGGGAVTVVFSGAQEMLSINIDKEAVDPDDVDSLQDLVLSAVNAGLRKSQDLAHDALGNIPGASGINLPGLF